MPKPPHLSTLPSAIAQPEAAATATATVTADAACLNRSASSKHAASESLRFAFSRIDWATLLKRIYDVDALACMCGGRLRFIALILEPEAASKILDSLGLPSKPPPVARARAPDLEAPAPQDW